MQKLNSFVAIDTETTGVPPKNRPGDFSDVYVTEMGAVVYQDGQEIDRFSVLSKLPQCVTIHPKAQVVSGIDGALLDAAGMERDRALISFAGFVGQFNLPLVGQNIFLFDLPLLRKEMMSIKASQELCDAFAPTNIYDTKLIWLADRLGIHHHGTYEFGYIYGQAAAIGMSKNTPWYKSSLEDLTRDYFGPRKTAHRAEDDARAAAQIWLAMVEKGIADEVVA